MPLKDFLCMQEAVSRGLSLVLRCCLLRDICEHCAEDSPGSLGKQLMPAQEEGQRCAGRCSDARRCMAGACYQSRAAAAHPGCPKQCMVGE